MTPKKSKGIGAYLLVVVLLLLGVFFITQNIGGKENDTQYSEIMNYFDDYDVKKYTLNLGNGQLKMTLQDNRTITYEVPYISGFLDDVKDYRQEYNAKHPDAPLQMDYYKMKDSSWILDAAANDFTVGHGNFAVRFYDAAGKRRRKVYVFWQGKYQESGKHPKGNICRRCRGR